MNVQKGNKGRVACDGVHGCENSFVWRFFTTNEFYRIIGPMFGLGVFGSTFGSEIGSLLPTNSTGNADFVGAGIGAILGCVLGLGLYFASSRRESKRF